MMVVLKITTFVYLLEIIFLYEHLWMKFDRLSMTLGMEYDAETHCKVKHIIVPANFAKVIGSGYPHDGPADNVAYPHDSRADNAP